MDESKKVKELISFLQKCDPEAEVRVVVDNNDFATESMIIHGMIDVRHCSRGWDNVVILESY